MLNKGKKLRAGTPAAPRGSSLVLLPFGSDTVRRALPRRTHPKLGGMIPQVGCDVNRGAEGTGGFSILESVAEAHNGFDFRNFPGNCSAGDLSIPWKG